jgi:hypothetical protein
MGQRDRGRRSPALRVDQQRLQRVDAAQDDKRKGNLSPMVSEAMLDGTSLREAGATFERGESVWRGANKRKIPSRTTATANPMVKPSQSSTRCFLAVFLRVVVLGFVGATIVGSIKTDSLLPHAPQVVNRAKQPKVLDIHSLDGRIPCSAAKMPGCSTKYWQLSIYKVSADEELAIRAKVKRGNAPALQ